MTRSRALLRATGAAIALLAAVVGLPALLLSVTGSPIPTSLPTWDQISGAILSPDDGTLLLGILGYTAWVCWAIFTASVLLDLAARLRGASPPSWGPQQALASRLVAAVLAAGITAPTLAAASPAPAQAAAAWSIPKTTAATVTNALPAHALPAGTPAAVPGPTTPDGQRTVIVETGDTFWDIADDELGDPSRWPELYEASRTTVQPDGQPITDPDLIHPGETITVPDDQPSPAPAATTPPVQQPQPEAAPAEDRGGEEAPVLTPRGSSTAARLPGGGGALPAGAPVPAAPVSDGPKTPVVLTPLTGGGQATALSPEDTWRQHVAADAAQREPEWRDRVRTPRDTE